MKSRMVSVLIFTLLSFWVPIAGAEISQDLDPMVPVDSQAIVTSESTENSVGAGQVSNTVSTADATASDKKAEETKRKKTKKNSSKKSSKKSSKSGSEHSSQNSKKHKKSSN